jgi:hypothetical protein
MATAALTLLVAQFPRCDILCLSMSSSISITPLFSSDFDNLLKIRQKQILLYVLSLCEIELHSVKIDLNTNKYTREVFLIDANFVSAHFSNGKSGSIHSVIDNTKSSAVASVLKVLVQVIDFIDQLPFENLLSDTEDTRNELLQKIEDAKRLTLGIV